MFISKGYGIGCAVFRIEVTDEEPWTTEGQWAERGSLKTKFANVVIENGYAYGLSDGILECVRLSDGQRAWKRGRYGQGQILAVGDLLLVLGEDGQLRIVETTPEEHRELARMPAIEGQTWNNLCLSGDRLLLRNGQEAACYRLPLVTEARSGRDAGSGNAGNDGADPVGVSPDEDSTAEPVGEQSAVEEPGA